MSLIAASCEHDAESYTPGEQAPAGCQSMYFATTKYVNTVEVEPEVKSFDIAIKRVDKSAAGTVNLSVVENEGNVFVLPATASFAAGEETTSITVTYPTAKEGIKYALVLAVEGDNVSPYTNGYREVQYDLSILKWESIGTGYMLDGLVVRIFGVDPTIPLAVEIEKTTTASGDRYRFDSPFASVATGKDENGGYIGYPYNEPADVVPGIYKFVIDVTKDGLSLQPVSMGMDWGYGMFSCGSVYGYLSTNLGTYPLGTLKNNVMTFPVSSLYVSMTDFNDGGKYPCTTPTYIYLTAEAYLESLKPAK
ncbi:hypothetical protein LJC21_03550 [Bacteroides sp. OttesenSCG-928-E20]|nr:hypothetical protein [Bacteroides sp. OttesenSCG-928-E20]MDL2303726.1 hypothetical protein [Bacteroides sp. OttesenSCG-928-D19]